MERKCCPPVRFDWRRINEFEILFWLFGCGVGLSMCGAKLTTVSKSYIPQVTSQRNW